MSLRSGRHGIANYSIDWKTGKVRAPAPAGQIIKTYTKEFNVSATAAEYEIFISFENFAWSSNYIPMISLICHQNDSDLLSLKGSYLYSEDNVVIGIKVVVNQSDASIATRKATVNVVIVNKA